MRGLFVGNVHEQTGWGEGGRRLALALDRVMSRNGAELVVRPLSQGGASCPVPLRLNELMARSAAGPFDFVLQNVLPHQSFLDRRLGRNIAYFCTETSDFRQSSWAERLNQLDGAWVPNEQARQACLESGVTIPVQVVGYPWEEELPPSKEEGVFTFYYIGECVRRKNLGALIRAFLAEFGPDEKARLLLKVSHPRLGPEECRSKMQGALEDIRRGMKVSDEGKVEVLTGRLTAQEVLELHARCHCFVTTSYGEAWSLPAFTAMAMGKAPIVPASSGFLAWARPDCCQLVATHEELVFGAEDTFPDLHTGREWWWATDHRELRRALRKAFERPAQERAEMARSGLLRAKEFSYEAVGRHMLSLLEADNEKVGRAAMGPGP